ncbi:PEP-CTERM sorting domain-containing protein [Rugamonas aquatica]|uniref:PEP-CTERM sorting domain-containing protein n=1 Tax=Rugamonas aquatica TaxID=2743357 RepID=UPI001F2189A9|nr:PEP-CTERM sorting domain-containing protein [Rugamonas aquatica]
MKKVMKAALALALAAPLAAFAAVPTVSWTAWSNGNSGTLTQNAQTVNVSYSGDTIGVDYNAYIYDVPSSFTSAEVTNTPGTNGTILMSGGYATVNSFHFDKAVVNPYIELFSVGQNGVPVTFAFQGGAITILSQGGGHWNGGTLTQTGPLTISGEEGNGLLKFTGTYTDITFVTPNYEYYYGATVGAASIAAVPEPETYAMLLAGLGLVGAIARRRKAAR